MKNCKILRRMLKSSTSLFLTVMMVITCFSAISLSSTINVSANTSNKFSANSKIYLKVDSATWGSDGAKFGAYFYYHDNEGYCYEKSANYTPANNTTASDYASCSKVEDNVYEFTVPDNGYLGYVIFVRLSSSNLIWNTMKTNADSMGSNKCFYVNGWNSSYWTSYSPPVVDNTPVNGDYNYYVPADNNLKSLVNTGNYFTVNATYYDYWSDNERASWGGYLENEGAYIETQNDKNLEKWWYQFDDFNTYISNYAKDHPSWKFPLYFGNLYKGDEHYNTFKNHTVQNGFSLKNITGITDVEGYNQYGGSEYYAINNSNGMYWYNSNNAGSYNQPLQGLVGDTLDSNGNMLVSNSGSTTVMPYFDGATLASKKYNGKRVATVIKSVFPFRTETGDDGVTQYAFTSKDARDNVYFTWNSSGAPKTIKYGSGTTYGVHDKLSKFGGDSDGYGLFPFNNAKEITNRPGNDQLDYGFGIKLDIDFRVPERGILSNGDPVQFTFTGDDDLWVYIGEKSNGGGSKLVLDLAGDHKEAKGIIDFSTMQATAKNVFADYSSGTASVKNKDVVKDFTVGSAARASGTQYLDPGKTYHMTVFYMERGESESNFSVGFSMTPVNNTLTVDKTVNVDNVNEDLKNSANTTLKSICKNLDQFGYEITSSKDPTANIDYDYVDNSRKVNAKTTADKKFPLGDGDSAFFNGTFNARTSDSASDKNIITVNELNKAVVNNYTVGKNIVYINTGTDNWFTNDGAIPYISLSGETAYHAMNKLSGSSTIYYYALDNNTGVFDIGRYVGGTIYNSKSFAYDSSKSQINVPDGDWAYNTVTTQSFTGPAPSGSTGTIGSNEAEKLTYNTTWAVTDRNNESVTMPSGTGKTASFEFINGLSGDERFRNKTDLQLSYVNTVVTDKLTVTKKLYEANGTTEVTSTAQKNEEFTFKLYLDTNFDNKFSETEVFGTYTNLSVNNSVVIDGIPVGVRYQVKEVTKSGYEIVKGVKSGTMATNGKSEEFENKINPTSVSLSVNKTLDGAVYSGSAFKFTQTALDNSYNDTADVKTQASAADGVVSFGDIALNTSGTYFYKITEGYNGTPNYDYQVNNTVVLARVSYTIGEAPTVEYAVFTGADVAANATMVASFDSKKTTTPTFANVTTDLWLNVTKSEGLKDENDDGVAELVVPIEGAKFELYKVASDNSTDFSTVVGYGKSDTNGKVEFYTDQGYTTPIGGLDIFNPVTSNYQYYAVKEVAAAPGYVIGSDVFYVCANDSGKVSYNTTEKRYESSFGFTNDKITIPLTGIQVQRSHFIIGCVVLSIGALLGAYYVFASRRKKYAYVSRHGR